MGQTAAKVPAGTIIEPSKSFDALLKIYEDEMMGAVNAMPADKYNFAPSQAIFKPEQGVKYDGVRTFGQMVAHIAQANFYFFSTLGGAKPDVDMKAIGGMASKEDTVKAMKPGSVVVDMAIEQGGNCPLTERDKIVVKYGVKLIGISNLPALVAADASALYARNLLNFLNLLVDPKTGELKLDRSDEIIAGSLVCIIGEVVKKAST